MERQSLQFNTLESVPTPREKLSITHQTHLLKFVYKGLPIGETLVCINNTTSPKCPSCNLPIKTHNHIFWCPNTQRQQVTNDCLAQINLINLRWNVPEPISTSIQAQLTTWTNRDPEPPAEQIATNLHHTPAIQAQTQVRWGHFFKGFCTSEIQTVINTQCNGPLNAFEQLCKIIQCMWDSELEYCKLLNGNKHSHTIAETDAIKHEQLLATTSKL
jgi:hypothetical protein